MQQGLAAHKLTLLLAWLSKVQEPATCPHCNFVLYAGPVAFADPNNGTLETSAVDVAAGAGTNGTPPLPPLGAVDATDPTGVEEAKLDNAISGPEQAIATASTDAHVAAGATTNTPTTATVATEPVDATAIPSVSTGDNAPTHVTTAAGGTAAGLTTPPADVAPETVNTPSGVAASETAVTSAAVAPAGSVAAAPGEMTPATAMVTDTGEECYYGSSQFCPAGTTYDPYMWMDLPSNYTCIQDCPPGYAPPTEFDDYCWQDCPPDFRNDGLFCGKPSSYGRGTGNCLMSNNNLSFFAITRFKVYPLLNTLLVFRLRLRILLASFPVLQLPAEPPSIMHSNGHISELSNCGSSDA
jgi:hypothetical protein